MATLLRSRAKVEVLDSGNGTGVVNRAGEFDDGKTWAVSEVVVIDEGRNKVALRIDKGASYSPGFYDMVLDTQMDGAGKGKVRVVSATSAKAA